MPESPVRTIDASAFRANCPTFAVENLVIDSWYVLYEVARHGGLNPSVVKGSLDSLKRRLVQMTRRAANDFGWRISGVTQSVADNRYRTKSWSSLLRHPSGSDPCEVMEREVDRDAVTVSVSFAVPVVIRTVDGGLSTEHVLDFLDLTAQRDEVESSSWQVSVGSFGFSIMNHNNDWAVLQIVKARPAIFRELVEARADVEAIERDLSMHASEHDWLQKDWGSAGVRVHWPRISRFNGNAELAEANSQLMDATKILLGALTQKRETI